MSRESDLASCRAILARGSKSFDFASSLLPVRLRDPVAAFYAFCRVSDDAIDESTDPRSAHAALLRRVDLAFEDRPVDEPVDRALAWLASEHRLRRACIDALLEGYVWDVEGRTYPDFSSLLAYAARVAASVGVAMTSLMGIEDRLVMARAADLGLAMQLTNMARDVGEDARRRRIYMPLDWLAHEGLDPVRLVSDSEFSPALGRVVMRLLDHADVLYRRASSGIAALPADCRVAIHAASSIYQDIGRMIRAHECDSVSSRAKTGLPRKTYLVARALLAPRSWVPSPSFDPPLPEVEFLLGGT